MNITTKKNPIKTIKKTDPGFYINDGITINPRAGFEISQSCPREYKLIISECINRGWLTPVAFATSKEFTFMSLANSK